MKTNLNPKKNVYSIQSLNFDRKKDRKATRSSQPDAFTVKHTLSYRVQMYCMLNVASCDGRGIVHWYHAIHHYAKQDKSCDARFREQCFTHSAHTSRQPHRTRGVFCISRWCHHHPYDFALRHHPYSLNPPATHRRSTIFHGHQSAFHKNKNMCHRNDPEFKARL